MMYSIRSFLRTHLLLLLFGVLCELLYLGYFVRTFPLLQYYQGLTDMGYITGHSHVGFTSFVLVLSMLFALFGFAWWEAQRFTDRATLWLILGFGMLFALTMSFVYPGTAIDVFGYIVQSLVLLQHHANPMVTPALTFPRDPMMSLAGGWGGIGAPYGPLGILIDALPTALVGRNLLANLLLLKLLFSAMLLVEAFLVYKILSNYAPKLAVPGALFIAWNPYTLFEYSANGHNDVAVLLFVLLAILALVKERPVLAFALILASALIKYATLPLLPLFFIYGLVHQPTSQKRLSYMLWVVGVSLLLLVGIYGPFWSGPHTLDTLLDQDQRFMSSFSTVLADMSLLSLDPGKMLGRILFGGCYLFALVLATRRLPKLLLGSFVALFFFLALAVTKFEIWYAIWPTMLAVLIPRRDESLCALLLVYGASLSVTCYVYLWVWLGLNDQNLALIHTIAYFLAFVPALLVFFGLLLRRTFSLQRVEEKAV